MTAIEKYLSTRGYVIWPGVVFDLTDPKEAKLAAEWYRDFVIDFEKWCWHNKTTQWADLPG